MGGPSRGTHEYPLPTLIRTRLSAAPRTQPPQPEERDFAESQAAIVLATRADRPMEEPPCRPVGSVPCPDCGTESRRHDSCARRPSSLRPSSKSDGDQDRTKQVQEPARLDRARPASCRRGPTEMPSNRASEAHHD